MVLPFNLKLSSLLWHFFLAHNIPSELKRVKCVTCWNQKMKKSFDNQNTFDSTAICIHFAHEIRPLHCKQNYWMWSLIYSQCYSGQDVFARFSSSSYYFTSEINPSGIYHQQLAANLSNCNHRALIYCIPKGIWGFHCISVSAVMLGSMQGKLYGLFTARVGIANLSLIGFNWVVKGSWWVKFP